MEFGLDMAFKFECFFPAIPGGTEMMMLQGMTYKATLTLAEDVDPHDLEVEAWTSQCDKDNPDGDWHAIRLPYIDAKQCGVKHEYGVTEVITSDKNFNFTFRAKCTGPGYGNRDWVWSHPFGVNGFAPVLPCRAEDKWTQEPNYNHICGALHLGNFIAATHAKECGFTHVINVAETLDVVFPNKDVIYHKVFIKDGAHNPIEEEKLLDAVHWIKQHDVSGNKLLLNCRAGIGRAGSVAVAYVYYINPEEMSYDDAYNYCFNKRFVYPHSRLRERIEQVFPRTLKFVHFTPEIPSWNYMFMLEAMTYKTALRIPCHLNTDAQRLEVFAWTNQVDRHQSNGQWHRLKLTYIERDEVDRDLHLYGRSEIITGNRDFNFTFCVQPPGAELQWSHRLGEDGFAHVEPPRQYDNWTLGPDYTHILGSIHVGNFIAATNAEECGITHVLNVADNLDMVYPSGKVTYQKIPMSDGAHNPVSLEKIRDAVEWLRLQNKEGNKVLVNCRAGIGRAGSVGVAFVFAYETSWSYEDAYQHVFSKRFVYPHAGLKDILYTLYPRTH